MDEDLIVTLELDDGTQEDCQIICIFETLDREYIALMPIQDEDETDGSVYLYRYLEDEEGNPSLDDIEDEDEYDAVADAFDEILDTEDFEALYGDEE